MMFSPPLFFACFCIAVTVSSSHQFTIRATSDDQSLVSRTYGKVQGFTKHFDSTTCIDVFLGIPYAQPPVGNLRLKKPEPPLPWTGVKNVTSDMSKCVQNMHPAPNESEDCLYLDVYRPRFANSSQPLPVMMWIHGGGFHSGSKSKAYEGSVLASHGVIVVVINYRLGPLGFMSTEDDVIPGNFGMLDAVSALKWIQTNIASFGGDPNTVTIFGQSAGSASVSLLVLSPLTKGLFSRAIMESGVSSDPRAVLYSSSQPKADAMAAGRMLGCNQSPGAEFLSCLQKQDVHDLYNASLKAAHGISFRPRVETVFGFLPDYPLHLWARGEFNHVDTIRGSTSQEQANTVSDPEDDGLTREEFRKAAHNELHFYPFLDANKFSQLMEDVYLTNVTDPFEIRSRTVAMKTDFTFIGPIVHEAKVSQKMNPGRKSFLYKFNYSASNVKSPAWKGVTHGSDVGFVFGHKTATADDQRVSQMMTTMWTNFAKYGNPTPSGHTNPPLIHWNQFSNNRPSYLLIDSHLEKHTFDSPLNLKMLDLYESTQKEYTVLLNSVDQIIG